MDENTFHRNGPVWPNNASNDDPFQMVSMQLDGDWVYSVSVKAGRQDGPMMLRRVSWQSILNPGTYQCWTGTEWSSPASCQPILSGRFGEPSLRKLGDDTWIMAYLDITRGAIVTRFAPNPIGPWSIEKVQIDHKQCPNLYGGFIHPRSTRANLVMMISNWIRVKDRTVRYDVSQFVGTA